MRRLMILEVSQKQAYIFASRRLRENAARSEDIRYVTESRSMPGAATRCCNLTAVSGPTPLPVR